MEERKRNVLAVIIACVVMLALVYSFGLNLFYRTPDFQLADPTVTESGSPGASDPGDVSGVTVDVTVADDAVEIKKVTEHSLVGTAPELIRHYIELRGIGVTNVAQLFGMGAVKDSANIDMVIHIEPWRDGYAYDRMGLEDHVVDILGVQVPALTIPVKPGRNLAVILEVAAMNNRQKKMGYNAAKEFSDRVNQRFEGAMNN